MTRRVRELKANSERQIQPNTAFVNVVNWKQKHLLKKKTMICDPQQDFDTQGESTLTTRFHFKTKEFIWTRFSTFETIKSEEVEHKIVLVILNNSLCANHY